MTHGKLYSTLSLAIAMLIIVPCIGFGSALASEAEPAEVAYNLYFGDLHSHTSYSDGTAFPDDAYAMAKGAGADFLAVTDHYFQLTEAEWLAMQASADSNTEDGEFVAMAGYEYYLSGINEINIYATETMAPYPGETPEAYYQGERMTGGSFIPWIYDWIANEDGAVGQWNHPLSYGCPVAWDYYQLLTTSARDLIIPEPSTIMLLTVGMAVLSVMRSSRRRRGPFPCRGGKP